MQKDTEISIRKKEIILDSFRIVGPFFQALLFILNTQYTVLSLSEKLLPLQQEYSVYWTLLFYQKTAYQLFTPVFVILKAIV